MRVVDWGWALLVVLVWGVNFVVIHVGLVDVPPLLLGALRFLLVASLRRILCASSTHPVTAGCWPWFDHQFWPVCAAL